ncbi:MAG TPA: cell wall-active antibiotics response protein LiaF [Bacillales bacterium]
MHRPRNHLGGYIVLFIGIMILMGILGLDFLIGPLIFAAAGMFLIRKKHRWIGLILLAFSVITLFESVLHIDIGGVVVAGFFIWLGYRLLTGKKWPKGCKRWANGDDRHRDRPRERERDGKHSEENNEQDGEKDWLDEEIEKLHQDQKQPRDDTVESEKKEKADRTEKQQENGPTVTFKQPEFRSSLIGDFRLMNSRFELDDLNLSNFIGDVKIDLSKAIIPEGVSTLAISGFIGDVDIYVPYDLDVSVSTSVTVGNLDVLGHKQGGFNRQIFLATKDYPQSSRKVKISISVFIGDVDVRFL